MRKGFAVNLKGLPKVNCAPAAIFSGSRCFLCSSPSNNHETMCRACLNDMAVNADACPACAKPNTASNICADCLSQPWQFIKKTTTLFQYHYPANHLIQRMKYKQGIDLANCLGKMLCKLLPDKSVALPDCILPVPLHSGRLISRGYNQSIELARPLSRQLGIKLDTSSCKRVRATMPQAGLSAKKRKQNVHNAFTVSKKIGYNRVLLIDDVITTGSTVNELARMLSLAGVVRIDVLAVARAN